MLASFATLVSIWRECHLVGKVILQIEQLAMEEQQLDLALEASLARAPANTSSSARQERHRADAPSRQSKEHEKVQTRGVAVVAPLAPASSSARQERHHADAPSCQSKEHKKEQTRGLAVVAPLAPASSLARQERQHADAPSHQSKSRKKE